MIYFRHDRIYFYRRPVHMLKSFEGLSGIVQREFPGELFSSACFIFLNRRRDKMKILTWDGDGFVIFYKRLEKGVFTVDSNGKTSLTSREFMMLFEGIKPKRINRRFELKKS